MSCLPMHGCSYEIGFPFKQYADYGDVGESFWLGFWGNVFVQGTLWFLVIAWIGYVRRRDVVA